MSDYESVVAAHMSGFTTNFVVGDASHAFSAHNFTQSVSAFTETTEIGSDLFNRAANREAKIDFAAASLTFFLAIFY